MRLGDLDVGGKRVFVRVDFNVPLQGGKVTDDKRIRAVLPTLESLAGRGARLVLGSHLGRPKGRPDDALRLTPVADRLRELYKGEVIAATDCIGAEVERQAEALEPGQVLLLENLRFHEGEKKNDPEFVDRLAALCDVYVNDAFGTSHRAHASVAGLPGKIEQKAAGLLVQKEIDAFAGVLHDPARPFVAVLGGAKVADKIPVLESLVPKLSALLIGGGMAYTFLRAQDIAVGASRVEEDLLETAARILKEARETGVEVMLPSDHLCGASFDAGTEVREIADPAIPDGWMGLDVGPETRRRFVARVETAGTVVWNGPMGVFEWPPFAEDFSMDTAPFNGAVDPQFKVAFSETLGVFHGTIVATIVVVMIVLFLN